MGGATGGAARPRPARPLAHRLLAILLGLGLAALVLAAGEAVLALLGVGRERLAHDPFVAAEPGIDLFALRRLPDGREVYATQPAKLAFFDHQEFARHKAPGAYRIFAVGDSTTAGRPYDARVAFCRWLALYLDDLEPARPHECINAGADSYASYRSVTVMQELVRYQPDLFVVYTGHNEFLEERTYSDLIHSPAPVRRLRIWLSRLRLYDLLAGPAARARRRPDAAPPLPGEVQAKLDAWTGLDLYHRDDALRAAVVAHFTHNLERMAAIARAHDVAIVFVQPVSNLKDFSPFKSEHPAALGEEQRARFAGLLAEGKALAAAGDLVGALGRYRQAASLDRDHAELQFLIGRAHLEGGDLRAAEEALRRAKDLDIAPLRALEVMVERVGEVARRAGALLVDLPAALAAEARARTGNPIPGDEFLLDHVHPDIPVQALIAERTIEALRARGLVRGDPAAARPLWRETYERIVAGLDRRYLAERDLRLAKVLGWAGKLREAEAPLLRAVEVIPEEPDVHFSLGVVYQRTGRPRQALAALRRAAELRPDFPATHLNLGVVFAQLGRLDEGIAALEEALRRNPDYPEALHDLGILLARSGRAAEATAVFERALALRPGAAETEHALAQLRAQQGAGDNALALLRQRLAAQPGSAPARTDLGIAYARLGRLSDAQLELEEAARRDPGYAEAHFNLGVVLAARGRRAEAAAAYERALAADPDHPQAHNNLAILLAAAGRGGDARAHLVRATEVEPGYAEAHFNLGVLDDGLGRREAAAAAIRRALEIEPENPRFHLALGLLYLAGGRTNDALPHLREAQQGGLEVPPEVAARLPRRGSR